MDGVIHIQKCDFELEDYDDLLQENFDNMFKITSNENVFRLLDIMVYYNVISADLAVEIFRKYFNTKEHILKILFTKFKETKNICAIGGTFICIAKFNTNPKYNK